MGNLADALNFEQRFTVGGVTFTARRLTLAEILACAVAGVRDADGTNAEEALDKAEEMILGDGARIVFPRAGIMSLITTASGDLDAKDAEALARLRPEKTRKIVRFVIGLTEEGSDTTSDENEKPKKKARRLIGWFSTRG